MSMSTVYIKVHISYESAYHMQQIDGFIDLALLVPLADPNCSNIPLALTFAALKHI